MSDTNEHSLSLSYQIRRAIKAEDALTAAQKEIEKLNSLLNAVYVSREEKEKQYDEALCVVAEQRDTLKLRIRQHLANRYAYTFKEFCEELEEILYAPNVTTAQQAQPEPSDDYLGKAYRLAKELSDHLAVAPAQPERAPSDDPLQGAVDWFLQADGEFFCVATVQRTLRIGYNRAKRLCDIANERAAIKQGGQHD